MEEHVETVFLSETEKQCEFAMNAVLGLNNVLERLNDPQNPAHSTLQAEVFRAVHSFLTHASNVSRLLWPAPPRRYRKDSDNDNAKKLAAHAPSSRAKALRERMGLTPEHTLKSRRLRDHLEHFDERLDEWERTSVRKNYAQDLIGPKNMIAGLDATDMMRWFDNTNNHFYFRGEEYDLQKLADAVGDVRKRAAQAIGELEDSSAR